MKKKFSIKLILNIYFTYFKLGCFSFGGGYAMIPLMQREVVDKKKWIDKKEIIDVFAISGSLPGAIALNSSAFVGYSIGGVPGAIAALLGNLSGPFLIVLTLSALFLKNKENPYVRAGFNGIKPAVVGLIYYAAYKIGKLALVDYKCVIITIAIAVSMLVFNIKPIPLILAGIVLGILLAPKTGGKDLKEGV